MKKKHYKLYNKHLKGIDGTTGSLLIGAAITAYARIEINKFKRIPDGKVYYTDTDLIFCDFPMP